MSRSRSWVDGELRAPWVPHPPPGAIFQDRHGKMGAVLRDAVADPSSTSIRSFPNNTRRMPRPKVRNVGALGAFHWFVPPCLPAMNRFLAFSVSLFLTAASLAADVPAEPLPVKGTL